MSESVDGLSSIDPVGPDVRPDRDWLFTVQKGKLDGSRRGDAVKERDGLRWAVHVRTPRLAAAELDAETIRTLRAEVDWGGHPQPLRRVGGVHGARHSRPGADRGPAWNASGAHQCEAEARGARAGSLKSEPPTQCLERTRAMKVSELMNPRVAKVGPKTPLAEILQVMLRAHLNGVVVVDRKNRLLGIVTYPDLSRRLLPTHQELIEHEEYLTDPGSMEDRVLDIVNVPVEEIMTKRVITVSPQSHAIKAGALMTARHVKQLPVVEADKVVGIISQTDIGWGLLMRYGHYAKGSRTVG
jgi:CBS domain-containing protein